MTFHALRIVTIVPILQVKTGLDRKFFARSSHPLGVTGSHPVVYVGAVFSKADPRVTPTGDRVMPKPIRASRRKQTDPTAMAIVGKGGEGFHPTTLAEMLSLSEVDMRIIDLRIGLVQAVRQLRQEAGLTSAQLAKRLEVSKARIAEIESPSHEPTLDSLLLLFFAVGESTALLCEIVRRTDESMSR